MTGAVGRYKSVKRSIHPRWHKGIPRHLPKHGLGRLQHCSLSRSIYRRWCDKKLPLHNWANVLIHWFTRVLCYNIYIIANENQAQQLGQKRARKIEPVQSVPLTRIYMPLRRVAVRRKFRRTHCSVALSHWSSKIITEMDIVLSSSTQGSGALR